MKRIIDVEVPCVLCGGAFPVGVMTMNDDELWECDDVDSCADRAARRTVARLRAENEVDAPPTDEQLRGFLKRNPEYLRQFLDREARAREPWFLRFVRREDRISGGRRWDAVR